MSRRNNTAQVQVEEVVAQVTEQVTEQITEAVEKAVEQVQVPATTEVQSDISKVDLSAHQTKSAKIRHLASLGYKRGDIARHLGIKYQFVRNVLIQPLANKAA
jgi:predicted Zn-dependent protease